MYIIYPCLINCSANHVLKFVARERSTIVAPRDPVSRLKAAVLLILTHYFHIFQHLFILWIRDESEFLHMYLGSSPYWHRPVFLCANWSCGWHCWIPAGPGRTEVGHCENPKPKYHWSSVGSLFARAGIWEKAETV